MAVLFFLLVFLFVGQTGNLFQFVGRVAQRS